jgi:predicted dehydrogenase
LARRRSHPSGACLADRWNWLPLGVPGPYAKERTILVPIHPNICDARIAPGTSEDAMNHPLLDSRRSFLMSAATVAAASTAATALGADDAHVLKPTVEPPKTSGPNDRIQIATIGMGIIGFIDTECALKVPGVELVAAADAYEGRRAHAKEVFGSKVQTYVDYRDILARKDVDAVLICVPDHWHAKMSIDAMEAGKAVYCEKPMIRTVAEGPAVIAAQKKTKVPFQVGSQYASSVLYDKVKELIRIGALGKLHAIEARYNRNSDIGAWQYSIPTDASPATIDWDRFLGEAPKRSFDPVRFFRWRNYWDYGTAVAGDLFIHLLTGIHHATGAIGPTRVAAMGGQRYWDDGRDVYDIIMGLLDYPETDAHGSFTLSLVTDFQDGGGGATSFRFVGTDGVIDVSFTELKLTRVGIERAGSEQVLKGYNSVKTFANAQQKAFAEKYLAEHPKSSEKKKSKVTEKYVVPKDYDERFDHFVNFFKSVREHKPVYEDATFGYRAAAPALLCNDSYRERREIDWDPVAMKVVS